MKETLKELEVFESVEYKLGIINQEFNRIFEGLANLAHLLIDDPCRASSTSPGIEIKFDWSIRRKDSIFKGDWSSDTGADL